MDADTGQIRRLGCPVRDSPPHDEGVRELIPEEPEARNLNGEAKGGGLDFQDLDLKQITWLGSIDVDRPGQRMDHVQVDLADLLCRRSGRDLAVQRVPGFERDPIAGVDSQNRGNVRVPAIVAGMGFGLQGF